MSYIFLLFKIEDFSKSKTKTFAPKILKQKKNKKISQTNANLGGVKVIIITSPSIASEICNFKNEYILEIKLSQKNTDFNNKVGIENIDSPYSIKPLLWFSIIQTEDWMLIHSKGKSNIQ